MGKMTKIKYPIKQIIIHTAAYKGPADAAVIRSWHIKRGFLDIGYHFVITGSIFDKGKPEIQQGRSLIYKGAHAKYSNNSIGICVTGDGDYKNFTFKQYDLLYGLLSILRRTFSIEVKNIKGHRETPWERLKHFKTCPGKKVNMDWIREYVGTLNVMDYIDDPVFAPTNFISKEVLKELSNYHRNYLR